jgi:lincosamide nucleotidyltransferase A/C/D/E
MGGWGVDALLHRETRTHHDLDLLVRVDHLPLLDSWLRGEGFERRYAWDEGQQLQIGGQSFETAFVEAHPDGRELDVHGVEVSAEGSPRLATRDPWDLPSDTLTGTGLIAGQTVPCVSREAQRAMHRGYELPEEHQLDLRLLDGSR